MEPVHREARFKAGVREAAHVSGFSGALQTVQKNNLAARRALGPLRLHQHLDAGLGLEQLRFHGEWRGIEAAGPKISRDREDVMIRYDGTKRAQCFILA